MQLTNTISWRYENHPIRYCGCFNSRVDTKHCDLWNYGIDSYPDCFSSYFTPIGYSKKSLITIMKKKKSLPAKGRKIGLITLGIILLLLIGFRLYLPTLVLDTVNKKLTEIDGYTGHVHDIDISLIVGSYSIKGLELNKVGGKIPVPFFATDVIDISLEWRALLKGALVAEIDVSKPILNFVKGPTAETSQTSIDKDWQDVVDELIPLRINRFQVSNGEIHYRDFHSAPKIDLLMEQVDILAENLSNANNVKVLLPSTAKATAFAYGGMATVNMKLNPLEKTPTFDINIALTELDIAKLNDFLRAYGNFDVHKGSISIYAEAAAKDNKLTGYTKPIVKDLKVVSWKEDKDNVVQLAWEGIVGLSAWIFKNHPKDQIATQVTFEGDLNKPDIETWGIIGQLLRNAFIQALYPSIENSISINTPIKEKKKGFLKNLVDGEDGDIKNKREDRKEDRKQRRAERKKKKDEA
jgi:hypothetical protein